MPPTAPYPAQTFLADLILSAMSSAAREGTPLQTSQTSPEDLGETFHGFAMEALDAPELSRPLHLGVSSVHTDHGNADEYATFSVHAWEGDEQPPTDADWRMWNVVVYETSPNTEPVQPMETEILSPADDDRPARSCGKPALFVTEVPVEEVSSRVCEEHLGESVRAVVLDFGMSARVACLSQPARFTCEWNTDDDTYKAAIEQAGPALLRVRVHPARLVQDDGFTEWQRDVLSELRKRDGIRLTDAQARGMFREPGMRFFDYPSWATVVEAAKKHRSGPAPKK